MLIYMLMFNVLENKQNDKRFLKYVITSIS
jgi:hypothetical protein